MAKINIQTPSIMFYFPNYESQYKRMQVFDKPFISCNGKELKNDITSYNGLKTVNLDKVHALHDIDVKQNDFFYIGESLESIEFETNANLLTFYLRVRYTPVLEFISLEAMLEGNKMIIPNIKFLKQKDKWRAYCKVENGDIQIIKDYRNL